MVLNLPFLCSLCMKKVGSLKLNGEEKADKTEFLVHILIFLRYIVKYINYHFYLQFDVAFMILLTFISGLSPCLIHSWSFKFLLLLNFNNFLPLYDLHPHFFPLLGYLLLATYPVPVSLLFFLWLHH